MSKCPCYHQEKQLKLSESTQTHSEIGINKVKLIQSELHQDKDCITSTNSSKTKNVKKNKNAKKLQSKSVMQESHQKDKKNICKTQKILQEKYPQAKTIAEIGSGLNYERKGLRSILEQAMSGISITLIITHKDRLARFGFKLIEYIIKRSGGKILVLNNNKLSPEQELTEDMLSIIHSFSSRLYGRRKYKKLEV